MSEQMYLLVGVFGTFLVVLLAGATMISVSRNRRSAQVLQGQLESAGISVSPHGAVASFSERVVAPAISRFSTAAARITPAGLRNGVARRLVLAGGSGKWTAELFLAAQLAATIAAGISGYILGMSGEKRILGPGWIALLAFVAYIFPIAALDRKAQSRQENIRRTLADTIDLLTISVEAGLAFDAALLHARRSMKGPMSDEIGRMLHEMQLGVKRTDAMRSLSERTNVEELRSFVLAMVQADVFGVSIASVLRAQSQELRTKRRQRAEERAMKIPVKLLFPMIVCILPALLILVVGPGVIRLAKVLF
ncbi:MAG TPA: type II secretion system F family protein [Actinomycetota bacterium]|jgi:tight adherence protein C|nr:type II secretion system F family protein [Actinomycetota bacterium]